MLEKKTDTPECVEFWAMVARVSEGVKLWPEWKRRLLETDPPLGRSRHGGNAVDHRERGE